MRRRRFLAWVVAVPLAFVATACGGSNSQLPGEICGTQVSADTARTIVQHADDLHEFNRVSREDAISAPCSVLSGRRTIASLGFHWTVDKPDVKKLQRESLLGLSEPRQIESARKSYIGNNGALSTTPCRTRSGNYFTLTLQLPLIKVTDRSRRGDIERFMRVYFPATVATLGCS